MSTHSVSPLEIDLDRPTAETVDGNTEPITEAPPADATADASTTDDAPEAEPAPEAESASASPQLTAHTAAAAPEAEKHARFSKRIFFFSACAVIAILVYAVANSNNLAEVFANIGDILAPVVIGGVIAYLCNPIMRFYEYIVFGRMKKSGLHRGLSLLMTVITVFGLLAGLLALILPELIKSIQTLVDEAPQYLDKLLSVANDLVQKITANTDLDIDISTPENLVNFLEDTIGDVGAKLQEFLAGFDVAGSVWKILMDFVTAFKNLFLGIFIAFYILASKEKRSAQIYKARAALLNEKQNKQLTELVKLVDKTFGGFIKGLLLDALAVGVMTFLMLTIFQVSEYNLLIAAICAVTNVIPVFGPFIGAIPSAIIVLISNPSKLLVFVILILVIQQIDGNILVPRIQGSNTGISSLAVLIAITVMGSLFGMMGMIIGVPIFAVIIELVKRGLEARLAKRGLATDTVAYYPDDSIGNAEEEVYYEHSHLRYVYDHSKLKVYIDRIVARFNKIKAKHTERKAKRANGQHPSDAPVDPSDPTDAPSSPADQAGETTESAPDGDAETLNETLNEATSADEARDDS